MVVRGVLDEVFTGVSSNFTRSKSKMFFSEMAVIFWMMYCTEAKATEVAPVEILVSVLMRAYWLG